MNTPETSAEAEADPSLARPTNVPLLKEREEVAAAIGSLGILDTITDPKDRKIIQAAAIFLQEPNASKNLLGITKHGADLAEIMAYMSEVPKEIDAMNEQFIILHCQYYIDIVEAELKQDSPNQRTITDSMKWALDIATTLAHPKPKGYGNDAPLENVRALEKRIGALSAKP